MPKFIDLTGRKFGFLTVVSKAERKWGKTRWNCICECGRETCRITNALTSGRVSSCGKCHRKVWKKHGQSKTRLYGVWASMRKRCYNQNDTRYERYGLRGIQVCEEWRNDFQKFYDWSIQNGYKIGLSIDRIDNNKGYFPDNCRWVTNKVQSRNNGRTVYLTINGEKKPLADWCDEFGFPLLRAEQRYKNMKKQGKEIDASQIFFDGNRTFKKVNQYTTDFEFIRTWDKIIEAEKFGFHHSCVSDCCRGKRKTAYGFIWRYAEG